MPVDVPTNNFPEVSLPFITDGGALPEGALIRIGIGYILTHALSPDGTRIAVGTSSGIYVYQISDMTRLWRRYTTYPIGFVAWSPDGTKLTTGEDNTFNNYAEPALWDAATGNKIADLRGAWYGATWSPDSTLIATLSYPDDGPSRLMIFDATGELVQTAPIEGTRYLSAAVWSPAGDTIAITDIRQFYVETPELLLWDVKANGLRARAEDMLDAMPMAIYFSPDGRFVTNAIQNQDGRVPIWATGTGQQAFTVPEDFVWDMEWSHSGNEIALLTYDRLVISNVPSGETARELAVSGDTVAWAPDDLHFAVSGHDQVSVINVINGAADAGLDLPTIQPEVGQDRPIIQWLPDNQSLSVSTRERMLVWNSQTGHAYGFATRGVMPGLRWLPDSTHLAVMDNDDTYTLWDIQSGIQVDPGTVVGDATLFETKPRVTSPDGSLVFNVEQGLGIGDGPVGGGRFYDESILIISDADTKGIIFQQEYPGQGITSFAWSPDSARLALGFGTGEMRGAESSAIVIIDPRTGEELERLSAHTGDITGLAFSPDGKLLASTSLDCTVIVWALTS
jgi:WD40 repeat protein